MRGAWPADKPMGVRISVTDWVEGGWDADQSVVFAKELKKLGCDYIDISSGALDPRQQVPFAHGYNVPFAAKVKKESAFPPCSWASSTTRANARTSSLPARSISWSSAAG